MIILIIVTLLSSYVWLWYINTISHSHTQSRHLWVSALLLGAVMTTTILFTPYVLRLLQPSVVSFFGNSSYYILAWRFVCLIIGGSMIRLLQLSRSRTYLWSLSLIYIISLIAVSTSRGQRILPSVLFWYVVFAEEYLKTHNALARHHHTRQIMSYALTYGLLSGLGFGIIENIRYIIGQYSSLWLWNTAQLIAMRSISSVMMHLVFSGTIMRIYIKKYQKIWHVPAILFGYIVGATIHLLYNLTLGRWYSRILVLRLMIGYGILSRFLYEADSLYIKQWLKQS